MRTEHVLFREQAPFCAELKETFSLQHYAWLCAML